MGKSFIWTGQFADYTSHINNALIAQYSGVQSVVDLYDHDSNGREYEMSDGSTQSFSIDDGYKSFSMMGITKALEFVQTNLKAGDNIHYAAKETAWDHGAAQGLFVMGYRSGDKNPDTAMIVEGSWWENEARSFFLSLE